MNLPLDIKYKIASFDIDIWIKLALYDDEFKQFSYKEGRKLFINLFTVKNKTEYEKVYTVFNIRHRENDQPAVIYHNGSKYWYLNGKKHRDDDKPAIVLGNGDNYWFCHDELHRDNDKPAMVTKDGTQEWYNSGMLHRDNGPAIITPDGKLYWFQNNNLITI